MAIKGRGAYLSISDGASSPTYNKIIEIKTLGLSRDRDVIDTSNLDTDDWRSYLEGLQSGTVTASGNYVPANAYHQQLETDKSAGTDGSFKIYASNGANWTFNAIITNLSPDFGHEDAAQHSVSLQVTSEPQFSAS